MSQPNEFNERSNDALFATIIARLNQQDRDVERRHAENLAALGEIRTGMLDNRQRITALELARKYQLGWIAGATAIGGGIFTVLSKLL